MSYDLVTTILLSKAVLLNAFLKDFERHLRVLQHPHLESLVERNGGPGFQKTSGPL